MEDNATPTMKWSIHAAVALRVPRFASMRTMLICGIRSIVLLRSMSPDRMRSQRSLRSSLLMRFPLFDPRLDLECNRRLDLE